MSKSKKSKSKKSASTSAANWREAESVANALAIKWAMRLGGALHPDTPADEYVDSETGKPSLDETARAEYDRDMDALLSTADYGVDPYDVAGSAVAATQDRRVLRAMSAEEAKEWNGLHDLPSGRTKMIAKAVRVDLDGSVVDATLVLGTTLLTGDVGDGDETMLQLFTTDRDGHCDVVASWVEPADDAAEQRLVLLARMLIATASPWSLPELRHLGAEV